MTVFVSAIKVLVVQIALKCNAHLELRINLRRRRKNAVASFAGTVIPRPANVPASQASVVLHANRAVQPVARRMLVNLLMLLLTYQSLVLATVRVVVMVCV
jgi:hypothetical protein